jgi:thioredoxin-related protein
MRILSLVLFVLSLFSVAVATDDGLTNRVSWDQYSLMVEGKRVFIFAGEFHYQRLPVPELWPDIFQKFRANGLNAVR